jgi:hypothetical protein
MMALKKDCLSHWEKLNDDDYMSSSLRKHFHCYATANDSPFYFQDLRNLRRIKNLDPGVDRVFLFIAVSAVHKSSLLDRLFVKWLKAMFRDHAYITLVDVFSKPNIGRDFSSYELLLGKVKAIAADEDYVFFQNRSAHGPFRTRWYSIFIEQMETDAEVALCGSTINFLDHPTRSLRADLPHIQTYSFLSTLHFMKMLGEKFPGSTEIERNKIITEGEIGLSQFFLEKGYKITCIEWPDMAITNQSESSNKIDIKKSVTARHCFYHKKYPKLKLLLRKLKY